MKYLHVYVWNTFFVYEYSTWKNAKVSELVKFLIYLDNTVMQLYFVIPSKDKKNYPKSYPKFLFLQTKPTALI